MWTGGGPPGACNVTPAVIGPHVTRSVIGRRVPRDGSEGPLVDAGWRCALLVLHQLPDPASHVLPLLHGNQSLQTQMFVFHA